MEIIVLIHNAHVTAAFTMWNQKEMKMANAHENPN